METNYDKWADYLSPENLKSNLFGCSLYISIYESFCDYVLTQLKFFYHTGFDETGDHFDPKYKSEVLSLHKNPINASLKWFIQNNAIDDIDYKRFHELRKFRNKLTHEMMDVLFEGLTDDYDKNLSDLINLKIKVDRWWVLEIEIPTNADAEKYVNVKPDEVISGSQILLRLIMDMLSDDPKTANFYREEFIKRQNLIYNFAQQPI